MGKVTEYLQEVVRKQIDEHGIVIWYDPEGDYRDVVPSLQLENTAIQQYTDAFIRLRYETEPYLNQEQSPRLLVYVPFERDSTDNALLELEVHGVVLQPGQQPPQRNMRFAVVAKNALSPVLGEETAADIRRKVEQGRLTFADVESLAEQGEGIARGGVTAVLGTSGAHDTALVFLKSDDNDAALAEKDALPELSELFEKSFELDIDHEVDAAELRNKLARHVLVSELSYRLEDELPESLQSVSRARNHQTILACVNLAETWRHRRDMKSSYIQWADLIASELGLTELDFSLEQLNSIYTFRQLEESLQQEVERSLLSHRNIEDNYQYDQVK